MGIYDRDYMRRADGSPRTLSVFQLVVIGIIAAVFCGAALSLCQSARNKEPAKGSLRVNINTATLEEIETILNIGPARAQSIVDHRPYTTVNDLVRKGALGKKMAENISTFVKTEGKNEKLKASP